MKCGASLELESWPEPCFKFDSFEVLFWFVHVYAIYFLTYQTNWNYIPLLVSLVFSLGTMAFGKWNSLTWSFILHHQAFKVKINFFNFTKLYNFHLLISNLFCISFICLISKCCLYTFISYLTSVGIQFLNVLRLKEKMVNAFANGLERGRSLMKPWLCCHCC